MRSLNALLLTPAFMEPPVQISISGRLNLPRLFWHWRKAPFRQSYLESVRIRRIWRSPCALDSNPRSFALPGGEHLAELSMFILALNSLWTTSSLNISDNSPTLYLTLCCLCTCVISPLLVVNHVSIIPTTCILLLSIMTVSFSHFYMMLHAFVCIINTRRTSTGTPVT